MRRTKAEAAETREAILDAAEYAFLEYGVSRTTLSQIAERAGVTRGAIYFHFADKTEIYRGIIQRVRFPQEDLIDNAKNNDSISPLDILQDAAITCFERFVEDEHQQRVITILTQRCEYVGDFANMAVRLRQAHDAMLDLFIRMLYVAKARNMLNPMWSPENAAPSFIAVVGGLINEWLNSGKAFDLKVVGEHTVRTQINAFRNHDVTTKKNHLITCQHSGEEERDSFPVDTDTDLKKSAIRH